LAALLYKNSTIHALLNAGIAGLAAGNKEKILELRSLLQFEFFFAEKDAFLKEILALPSGLMIELYAFMLDDVLENICTGLRGLISMPGITIDAREWKNRLMKFGQSGIEESTVNRPESINTQSFIAFVSMAENRGWLKKPAGNSQQDLLTPASIAELTMALEKTRDLRPNPLMWDSIKSKYLHLRTDENEHRELTTRT